VRTVRVAANTNQAAAAATEMQSMEIRRTKFMMSERLV
jgi:hypothetical protein